MLASLFFKDAIYFKVTDLLRLVSRKVFETEWSSFVFVHYPCIFVEGLKKTTPIFNQDSCSILE